MADAEADPTSIGPSQLETCEAATRFLQAKGHTPAEQAVLMERALAHLDHPTPLVPDLQPTRPKLYSFR